MILCTSLLLKNTVRANALSLKSFTSDNYALRLKNILVLNNRRTSVRTFCGLGELPEGVEKEDGTLGFEKKSKEEMFEKLSNGNTETLQRLKILNFEVSLLRMENCRVPDRLSEENWRTLLELPTPSQRRKYLAFVRLNELKQISNQKKAATKKEKALKKKTDSGFHYYGLTGHTMFLRLYDKKVNRALFLRNLARPGLQLVFDCSYDKYMSHINVRACAKQISFSVSESRLHKYPSQITLCNFGNELEEKLPKYLLPTSDVVSWETHKGSYLDLYPRNKLVYLSPHTTNDLEFDQSDIFIIGAYVDKGKGTQVSLAKARENKVKVARLPIDKYVAWKQGTKSLPLNVVVAILLDMAFYKDWNMAFRNLPSRSLKELYLN